MSFTRNLSDLNREYDSIMKHNFDIGKFFAFHYRSRNYQGILFNANLIQKSNTSTLANTGTASCSFYYENDLVKTENKLKTTGDVKVGLSFNLDKYVKNLQSKVKIRTNYHLDEFDGKLRFFLAKNKYNVKSTLDWSANKCLTVSGLGLLVSGLQEELGFGAGLSFALEEKQFSLFNTSLWYTKGDAKIILSHKTTKNKFQAGKVAARVYNRLDEKTDIVFSVARDFPNHDDTMNFGIRRTYSDNLVSKLKIDSKLNVHTALELQVNKNVELVLMSKVNLGKEKTETGGHNEKNILPFALKLSFSE